MKIRSIKYGVYIVDNDLLTIWENKRVLPLRENGFKVIGYSTDPEKAVGEIALLKPELVISELTMEKMSGITLMKAIKSEGVNCAFILLTTLWSKDSARRFFHSGGSDYWVKPMDRQEWHEACDALQSVYGELESKACFGGLTARFDAQK